jgi:hypothetical protein
MLAAHGVLQQTVHVGKGCRLGGRCIAAKFHSIAQGALLFCWPDSESSCDNLVDAVCLMMIGI